MGGSLSVAAVCTPAKMFETQLDDILEEELGRDVMYAIILLMSKRRRCVQSVMDYVTQTAL